ncbi:amidohydrolase [Cryobacterium adonitolivorans]|uniref:Amidohydrolase n=1 Tax=Cryobacterium adonitolivorans TaxID=1259189 RepID=A0A4R8W7I8_9MICO|nr:amidohydrolase family protein [Cryobacterium adonitolivorans]TFC01153.1 amidohydrolase [Cryobacterium adonitolivorans]
MTSSVLRDVRIYRDGKFGPPEDLVIEGSVIGTDSSSALDVESGGYLIPGLIDSHVHVAGPESLLALGRHGVTTALDMGNSMSVIDSLRGVPGSPDLRAAGPVATSPTSAHATRMHAPPENLVAKPADAEPWVASRVNEGADYIKIVIDLPGFNQETVDALVASAHAKGRAVVAHASRSDAVAMAQRAGVDILTHAPLDRSIDDAQALELVGQGAIIVPTLTMMKGIVDRMRAAGVPGPAYELARDSVGRLKAAGMPILAGTDANATAAAPYAPPFGESLHDEFELLVAAGLSPTEALDAATSVPADRFGLSDRGRVERGLRADLVLLDENPLDDISATRSIRAVWIAGERV